jgi:hypothetical protein
MENKNVKLKLTYYKTKLSSNYIKNLYVDKKFTGDNKQAKLVSLMHSTFVILK